MKGSRASKKVWFTASWGCKNSEEDALARAMYSCHAMLCWR